MSSTEMPPIADAKDKIIADVLDEMRKLQMKVENLERQIASKVPANSLDGGNNRNENPVVQDSSEATAPGVFLDKDGSVGNNYYAIEGPSTSAETPDTFPADSYSMMVLNGPPPSGEWPLRNKIFFGVGLYVALFQIVGLILLTLGALLDGARGKLGEKTSKVVRAAQILSLSFYVVFPDASLHDFCKALRYFPKIAHSKEGDPVEIMRFACFLRGFQGLLAVVPMWLLVMTSESVVGVILNFSAINVISNFDEAAFAIARTGAMGPVYKAEVKRIESTVVPSCMNNEIVYVRYWMGVGLLNLATLVAMIIVWALEADDLD